VGSGFCSLENELVLVEKLLNADDRNFHGWGYRQFIARKMGLPVERELAFTQQKIEQNFSNYSAWHYRTALLPAMYSEQEKELGGNTDLSAAVAVAVDSEEKKELNRGEDNTSTASEENKQLNEHREVEIMSIERGAPTSASAAVPAEILDQEFELVKQAFFTEPEDQSGWFYHRWLLGCSLARYQKSLSGGIESSSEDERSNTTASAHAALINTLTTQAEMCKELLEIETDAKWPLLTYTRLCQLLAELDIVTSDDGGSDDGSSDVKVNAAEAYKTLEEMDPLRKGFYKDAAQGIAHVVALPLRFTSS
jgi:geranylgeranyl transferase type-2 subunit alpha